MESKERNTRAYYYLAIAILFAGIILGMILGIITAENSDNGGSFSFVIMLYVWIATALFDIFVFAIYSICHRLDLLIDKKK